MLLNVLLISANRNCDNTYRNAIIDCVKFIATSTPDVKLQIAIKDNKIIFCVHMSKITTTKTSHAYIFWYFDSCENTYVAKLISKKEIYVTIYVKYGTSINVSKGTTNKKNIIMI